ncbi:MAG: hypothetical protein ACR2PA_13810 [Hyphomicrobiaceae bacterium]
MSQQNPAEQRHNEFLRQQHEKRMTQSAIDANAEAAELIAERIAVKLAEQNDIIFRIGQKQGRTSLVAYVSLGIGGAAALGQLLGPLWEWPWLQQFFG